VIIEYCSRCKWYVTHRGLQVHPLTVFDNLFLFCYKRGHRATWVATELFSTFEPPAIASISLVPRSAPETAGRWRVWVAVGSEEEESLVWDRKMEGGFGELVRLSCLSLSRTLGLNCS
jgi:predicted Rdx family selenoprotein